MERKLVLDVSVWDEGIDLATWKSKRGVWAVIIKAGGNEGGRYTDRCFEEYYKKAVNAGLHRGVYYYTTSTTTAAAKADAEHLLGLIKGKSLDMPVYMDVEDKRQYALSKRTLTDVIKAFCDTIEAAGYKAGIYVNGNTWMNEVYHDELYKYADWIAWWRGAWPTEAEDGGTIGLWQQGTMRLSDGDVAYDDISGRVDCSWCVVDYPSIIKKKEDVMPTVRERLVAAARSQLGVSYYSMNYSAKDGYAGSMGTHYVGRGWGCAQFVAYCFNTVLGTAYVGSCWNYAGDALGQSVNQGGGEWRFIGADEALPGDCVLYCASGHTGTDYDDYGHIAMYVGNGRVIGAMGRGTPGSGGYLNIGIKETNTAGQSIGGIMKFIRCTRLDKEEQGVYWMTDTITFKAGTNVRTTPSMKGKIVAKYAKGDTCRIDGVVLAEGRIWGRYIGASSGQPRYVYMGATSRVTVK